MKKERVDTATLLARTDIIQVIDRYVPLKKAGAEFEACCPFHTEVSPSFKVSPTKQIYHCFGCGANGDAIGFLRAHQGMSFLEAVEALGGDLPAAVGGPVPLPARKVEKRAAWTPILPAPIDAPVPPRAHLMRGRPDNVWCYRDATGAVLGYVYRFTRSGGGKEVLPLVWARNDDTGALDWHFMAFPEPNRPLYGLDRLAANPDATVLIVEGEKCADAGAEELPDLVTVSWPGGGKADGKVDWSPLAGRKIITWADADAKREKLTREQEAAGMNQDAQPLLPEDEQPGVETMARIRGRLREIGCTKIWDVRLPPPGSKPDGWDIADAVLDGMRGAQLAAWIKSACYVPAMRVQADVVDDVVDATLDDAAVPEFAPLEAYAESGTNQNEPERKQATPLLYDAAEWLAQEVRQEWIVDGLIQRGYLYTITSPTNHGKTAISLVMALCVASGKAFAGRDVMPGKVLILCGENPDGFRTRTKATLEDLGLEVGDLAQRVVILPRALPLASVVERIVAEARKAPGEYALVLVDTSISYFSGDNENDNLQARSHAWNLRALVELPGRPAVIANAHPPGVGKDREALEPRGGSAFLNEIDTNLTVWSEGETATLHWHRKKRGPDFDPIPFEFHGKTVIEAGMKVPTVVATHITDSRALEIRRGRNHDEDRLLFAMSQKPDDSFATWATTCGWNGDKAKSKISRILERLKEDKLVTRSRKGWVLTGLGKDEARIDRNW